MRWGALLAWLLPGLLWTGAASARVGLDLELETGFGLDPGPAAPVTLDLSPYAEHVIGGAALLRFEARLRHEFSDSLSDPRERDSYWFASQPLTFGADTLLELRDLYLDFSLGSGRLRVGKQQVVWGNLDAVRVLDVANPQNYRLFILDDFGDSRISLWSALLHWPLGDWRTEWMWSPDNTVHDTPPAGAYFELTAPRFRFGYPPLGDAQAGLPLHRERDTGHLFGLRLSRDIGNTTLRLLGLRAIDPEPVAIWDSPSRLLASHQYRNVLGGNFETGLGTAVLRGEAALQPGRRFNTNRAGRLGVVRRDQLTLALAMDIQAIADIFVNVQIIWDRIDDPPEGLVRPDSDTIVTLAALRRFAYDRYEAGVRWYGSLSDGDGVGRAMFKFRPTDQLTATLEANLFDGSGEGVFGQFAERDMLMLRLAWSL